MYSTPYQKSSELPPALPLKVSWSALRPVLIARFQISQLSLGSLKKPGFKVHARVFLVKLTFLYELQFFFQPKKTHYFSVQLAYSGNCGGEARSLDGTVMEANIQKTQNQNQ